MLQVCDEKRKVRLRRRLQITFRAKWVSYNGGWVFTKRDKQKSGEREVQAVPHLRLLGVRAREDYRTGGRKNLLPCRQSRKRSE